MGSRAYKIVFLLVCLGFASAAEKDFQYSIADFLLETMDLANPGSQRAQLEGGRHSLREEWTELRTNGDMLIAGLQLDSFFDNGTECWDRYMNVTYVEYPEFLTNLSAGGLESQVLNVSSLISNVSEHGLVCSDFLRSIYDYSAEKGTEFGSFSGYTTAFF